MITNIKISFDINDQEISYCFGTHYINNSKYIETKEKNEDIIVNTKLQIIELLNKLGIGE